MPFSRIVLAPSFEVHEAVELLRKAGIPVDSGATVFENGRPERGIILIRDELDRALHVLAKAGIRARAG